MKTASIGDKFWDAFFSGEYDPELYAEFFGFQDFTMKTNNTPANVATLLTAAAYVRNETIINGNQAAQLDAMTGQIKDLTTKIEAVPAKIADLATQGKEKAVAMWERMEARYEAQFAEAVATLRAWLVDFKANRPNVNINLDEIDEPETPSPENTPTTMNANETKAPEFSDLTHAATNIVLAAENTQSIYAAHVEPLLRSLARKAAKGVTLSLDTLAKSYAMAEIIRESIKEIKRTSYDPFSANTDDRRVAALYLANIYIGEL